MSAIVRQASPGNFFAVTYIADSGDSGERYSSIAMDYSPCSVVSVNVPVQRGDYIRAYANGQIDQESVTNVIEVCQQLKFYQNGAWHEISEETGVNISARSWANVRAHLDRHHEDFAASGFLDLSAPLFLTGGAEVHWFFRARNGGTSAPVPSDSSRLIVEVWREFSLR
jgi:hypothetical protein